MADSDQIDLVRKDCAWSNPIDPTLLNNPTATLSMMMRMAARNISCCTPARIESYDRITHTAVVTSLCDAKTNTGDSIRRPSIAVHVIRLASGLKKIEDPTQPIGYRIVSGAIIDLPLTVGDTGWLIAADSDTFLQKSSNAHYLKDDDAGPSVPNTNIIHSFRHGVFIPDSFCSFPDIARFGDEMVIGTYSYNEETGEATITPLKTGIDLEELMEILNDVLPQLCVTSLNDMKGDIVLTEGNRITITPEINEETGEKTIKIAAIDQTIPPQIIYTQGNGINITNRQISNTGVLSIINNNNTLTGDITLSAGNNILMTVSGNTIEISSSGGSGGMFAWNESTHTMGPGGVFVGRKFYSIAASSRTYPALYHVQVTFESNGSISYSVVSNVSLGQSPTSTTCYIPIYQIDSDGKISADYRGSFVVPCYE